MPRGRRPQNDNQIELSPEDLNDLFRERICSKYLKDRMWNMITKTNEKVECSICLEQITQSSGYLLLVCGHDQVCAGCYHYLQEPRRCPVCRD